METIIIETPLNYKSMCDHLCQILKTFTDLDETYKLKVMISFSVE